MMKRTPLSMKMKRTSSRTTRFAMAVAVASLSIPVALVPGVAVRALAAQTVQKERIVDGKVVNKADAPVASAVVYLKDTRTPQVKTFICDANGHFHFGQLSQNTDYELWAAADGVKSNTKSISSFDSKNSFYFTLTIK